MGIDRVHAGNANPVEVATFDNAAKIVTEHNTVKKASPREVEFFRLDDQISVLAEGVEGDPNLALTSQEIDALIIWLEGNK